MSDLANEQREQSKPTGQIKPKRKRQRDTLSKQYTKGNSRVKRQKAIDPPKSLEATAEPAFMHGADAEAVPVPAEPVKGFSSTPPGILQVFPSQSTSPIPIQFITIPDSSAYKVVQLSSPPPPLIRLPLHSAAVMPTYIFVPAPSPTRQRQVPPLSPADGAVAPVLTSSFQPGSMSDTACKAMSPTAAPPPSPTNEMSQCKESPKSPTVLEIPQAVKDYIQQSKTHMSQACQHMEAGLRLSAHYVEVSVSQREILRSGKNTNRCLEKELIITGDIDRQKTSVGQSQIFDGPNGKRYNLLLGNTGMGKTTLIKKLCLDWSKDCLPQFDFVFLLDGRLLTSAEPVHSLQTLLLSQSSFASPCTDPEQVYAQVLAAPKRVLVVFDGFDELRDYEMLLQTQEKDLVASLQKGSKAQAFTVKQLFSGILQRVLLPGCTLLLATRPRGNASQLLRRADSFLEVCGFTPTHVETYVSQYFADPELRASALDFLKSCSYLHRLCWNPGVCHLVCGILEQCKGSDALPRTLTALCHEVLCLKLEKAGGSAQSPAEAEKQKTVEPAEEALTEISNNPRGRRGQNKNRTRARAIVRTDSRCQRARRTKGQGKPDEDNVCKDTNRTGDLELLSHLGSLAWEGVKSNSSIVPRGRTVSTKLRAFGLSTGLLLSQSFMKSTSAKKGDMEARGRDDNNGTGGVAEGESKDNEGNHEALFDCEDNILLWANPFLQSYMAAVHLVFSRAVTERSFLQTLPFQSGAKGRRKPQREELELTQRFAVGLLFHNTTKLQRLHSLSDAAFRDIVASRQALVMKHLEGLSFGDLSPAQVLEVCNYVYEASFTHKESGQDTGGKMLAHLAVQLPEFLTFRGVPLSPPDVFTVENALSKGGAEGRSFCLDLEDSGIPICGLKALVGLSNINTYRACIADVVTLWEELERRGDESLLQGAVSKFTIHPLKATQVRHIEHLEKLVSIHTHKRLSDSQSGSILAEGVPAVKELYKLEFQLGPESGPLALPKLWALLPGLQNLQHLDVENSKIGDKGAEKLANALVSLRSLEILNLSENCIGDQGVKKLGVALKDLPKLHCLSLYSNVISDEGAESLAAVLPHMASLTDLDVKYNKMTDVGAQSLGASLKKCKKVKTLRMWNQCIPYGVFERLQHQDSRILWH
ncbi:MHC class II transactivator [Fundulus diaphanus]